MKALTGLTVVEFESLVITFSLVLQKYQATCKRKRQRAVGGGRKDTLKTAAERLFFILFYVKCYPTMDLAGFFFGVDKSRIQRWVKELLPLLEETLGREVVLPARKINSVEEFVAQFPIEKDYPQLEVVIPHKKPKNGELTPEQRQENKIISQLRIKIEHTISRLKRFRAVADVYRNHPSLWADKFILIAAGLSNFHLRLA